MFLHYRTQGIILKKTDRGEADQLLTIYTKDFGKLDILAKAIRKIASKLRCGAELFYLSEIEFIQGKTQKTLTDAILLEKFTNLRSDLKKLAIAYKISHAFDNLIKGQEPDLKIWQLLKETFQRLNNLQFTRPPCETRRSGRPIYNLQLLYYYFLWNLFFILGYQPQLYNCVLCQNKLRVGSLYFNSREGGTICEKCAKQLKSSKEISSEEVKILRIMLKRNWLFLSKLKIKRNHLESLDKITKDYFSYIAIHNFVRR